MLKGKKQFDRFFDLVIVPIQSRLFILALSTFKTGFQLLVIENGVVVAFVVGEQAMGQTVRLSMLFDAGTAKTIVGAMLVGAGTILGRWATGQ